MREPAMAARMKQFGMVMEENGTASYVQFMKDDIERHAAAVTSVHPAGRSDDGQQRHGREPPAQAETRQP